jgi:hypothetical protein
MSRTVRCPIVGEIVLYHHFKDGRLSSQAAIVTAVHEPGVPSSSVSLTVFYPGMVPVADGFDAVPFDETPTDGRWSWR